MSASTLALAILTAPHRGRLGSRRGPVAVLRASAADHPDPSHRRPDAPSIDRAPKTITTTSSSSRRLVTLGGLAAATFALAPPPASRADESGPFCDFTQTLPCDEYPQYARTPSGLLYQDLRFGEGPPVTPGKRVVVDWDGYTFYLSHVIQARNLPKGGDFAENDEAFLRFVPGDGTVIPAFDEAVCDMRVGGIRRFIVRPGELSYPGVLTRRGGRYEEGVGPVPASLSGKRALEFVLRNTANVDKSLLFDVEVLAVEGAEGGQRGFRRGPGRWAEGVKGKLS